MGDISFAPTFHHDDWVDRVDRVQAGGPNGFNTRFRAVQADLDQLSTVVGEIGTALDEVDNPSPDPSTQHVLTFTPRIHGFPSWTITNKGVAQVTITNEDIIGVMNLDLPDGIKLLSVRAVGEFVYVDPNQQFEHVLRFVAAPLRLTIPPTFGNVFADLSRGLTTPHRFDYQANVNPTFPRVDHSAFRYYFNISIFDAVPDIIVRYEAFHLTYTT